MDHKNFMTILCLQAVACSKDMLQNVKTFMCALGVSC